MDWASCRPITTMSSNSLFKVNSQPYLKIGHRHHSVGSSFTTRVVGISAHLCGRSSISCVKRQPSAPAPAWPVGRPGRSGKRRRIGDDSALDWGDRLLSRLQFEQVINERRSKDEGPLSTCAVTRRRLFQWVQGPPGDPLPPAATGAGMEETKWLKPPDSGHEIR